MESKVVIYLNINSKGEIFHCITDLKYPDSGVNREIARAYEYSCVKSKNGLCHWCKRLESYHYVVPSNQIPDALRAFIMLMGD